MILVCMLYRCKSSRRPFYSCIVSPKFAYCCANAKSCVRRKRETRENVSNLLIQIIIFSTATKVSYYDQHQTINHISLLKHHIWRLLYRLPRSFFRTPHHDAALTPPSVVSSFALQLLLDHADTILHAIQINISIAS